MQDAPPQGVRKAAHTRQKIVDAFTALALRHRYAAIRMSDILTQAGVGKSTFYEHFRGKDDVLVDAMQPVILALATAASRRAARLYVREMVKHLWDRRSIGRALLDSSSAPIVQRSLAAAIVPHAIRAGLSCDAAQLTARGIAAAHLAMLRSWLAGETPSTIDTMTDRLIACSHLMSVDQQ